MRKRLCGEFRRHDMQPTPGGWKACSRCGTLSSKGVPFEVRFLSHVKKAEGDGCWDYVGCLSSHGYAWVGRKEWGRTPRSAHRVAWELAFGPIPPGEGFHGTAVLHKCDNRRCVRPSHLYLGTQKQNMDDMLQRERKGGVKLRLEQVREIRRLAAAGRSNHDIAEYMHLNYNMVSRVTGGRTFAGIV